MHGEQSPIPYGEQKINLYTKIYAATTPYLTKSFHINNQELNRVKKDHAPQPCSHKTIPIL